MTNRLKMIVKGGLFTKAIDISLEQVGNRFQVLKLLGDSTLVYPKLPCRTRHLFGGYWKLT